MLVRDPKKRASLQDILNHHWLTRGDPAPLPLLPLISWEHLTPEEHSLIISKMVTRKMASKEEILRALEQNAYNHITATYYLLAESRLRKQREKQAHIAMVTKTNAGQKRFQPPNPKPNLKPLALTPRLGKIPPPLATIPSLPSSPVSPNPANQGIPFCCCAKSAERSKCDGSLPGDSPLTAPPKVPSSAPAQRASTPVEHPFLLHKCSMIQEEVLEEGDEDMDEIEEIIETKGLSQDIRRQSYMEESLSDDSDTRSTSSKEKDSPSGAVPPPKRLMPVRPLHSVRSSPQLLNQIFEEGESEEEDLMPPVLSTQTLARSTHQSPEVIRKYEMRRKRLTKAQRGASHSSSDTSDTDDTESRRRREKFPGDMYRRDSSDHSSDTDGGQSGFSGGSGRLFGGSCVTGVSGRASRNKSTRTEQKGSQKSNSSKSSGRHTGMKQNGVSPTSSLLGKRDSSSDRDNSQSEVGRKGTSPQPATPSNKDMEAALNEENKARSRIIHVRSKDFSDLMERFSASKHKDSGTTVLPMQRPHDVSGIKFRKRPKDRIKTDINKNGLIAHADCSMEEEQANTAQNPQQQNIVKTKCCSVV
ncbi:hypothetical protein LSH36_61g05005 [Paralvinella palmiformis]|uniref:Uncharacterized protein n=1 Tax=Paralvinella palmiformis TaxID=53620 RepID=A0AAD9K482_9ANNE|nr:hypothetical protein LSH36_61g05005 [Paralvinella palmiformis]